MKITFATGPLLPIPALDGGAVQKLVFSIAQGLVSTYGHDVTIVAKEDIRQPDSETVGGVKIERWGGFKQSNNIYKDLWRDYCYATKLAPMLPVADITVACDFWLPRYLRHNPYSGLPVFMLQRVPKKQMFLYPRNVNVLVPTKYIADMVMVQDKKRAQHIKVIPNAVDTSVFYPTPQTRERVILFVGRIHPEKGLDNLIASFKLLKGGYKLRLIGPYQPSQGGGGVEYLKQLKQAALGYDVEFLDPVFDSTLLAKEYNRASIFCYPSLAIQGETFGVAPVEAMACGLQPVLSNLPCFLDIVDKSFSNFFDIKEPGGLTRGLQLAIDDVNNGDFKGKLACEFAQRFAQHNIVKAYHDYFTKLYNLD